MYYYYHCYSRSILLNDFQQYRNWLQITNRSIDTNSLHKSLFILYIFGYCNIKSKLNCCWNECLNWIDILWYSIMFRVRRPEALIFLFKFHIHCVAHIESVSLSYLWIIRIDCNSTIWYFSSRSKEHVFVGNVFDFPLQFKLKWMMNGNRLSYIIQQLQQHMYAVLSYLILWA